MRERRRGEMEWEGGEKKTFENVMASRVRYLVVGAGNRGKVYARYALEHPDLAQVVGVAEPRVYSRDLLAEQHHIPKERTFSDWRDAAAVPRFADAVVITTLDNMHVEPAVTFAKLGYHILLEKPMAVTEQHCRDIVAAVEEAKVMLAIGHVMRYTPYSQKIKQLLDAGAIGELINVQHLEPVGWYHFAHSYVRGNWHNEAESSSMLMAKCCHDLDWLRWVFARPCTGVSSFGSLKHFTPANRPATATDTCLSCPLADTCAYSAKRIYLDAVKRGVTAWPVHVVAENPTVENVEAALRTGPYGRCVYGGSNNDVLDNQVVNLEFEGGLTASFTVAAFTQEICVRKTRLFGTKGQIEGDGNVVRVFNFETQQTSTYEPLKDMQAPRTMMTGHTYGDYYLMKVHRDTYIHTHTRVCALTQALLKFFFSVSGIYRGCSCW